MDTTRAHDSVNIVCLYWVGAFRNRDFAPEDVERLRNTVDKHIDRPYRFYALTNDETMPLAAEKIPLRHNWPGWWSKVELHRPDLPPGRTLYLDLDSYVVRSLQPLLDYSGDLVMFDTRAPVDAIKRNRANSGIVYRYQAATMLFTPGVTAHVYEKFRRNPRKYMRLFRSDQDIMGVWIPDQPTFPRRWMMKITTGLNTQELPDDVIIITGQGRIPVNGQSRKKGDRLFRNIDRIPWLEDAAYGKEVR